MTVTVIAWSQRFAVADVDGTRVRVNRQHQRITWKCAEHGTHPDPRGCSHLQALAATPIDPDKESKR